MDPITSPRRRRWMRNRRQPRVAPSHRLAQLARAAAPKRSSGSATIPQLSYGVDLFSAPPGQLVPGTSLITKTPEEGRQLAIKMARLVIKATQPDAAARERLRPVYADDPAMLIAIGHTVALEFATIAAANKYWT